MKRRFSANLFIGADGVVHRHVKRVCVILSVRNAGNFAVFLLVYAHKAAGKPLCGRCEQGEVEAGQNEVPPGLAAGVARHGPGAGRTVYP